MDCSRVKFCVSLAYWCQFVVWFETNEYINCYINKEFQSLVFYILYVDVQPPSVWRPVFHKKLSNVTFRVYKGTPSCNGTQCFGKYSGQRAHLQNWDSIVCKVTRLQVGRLGVRIPTEARIFSLTQNIHTVSGIHPAPQFIGYRSYFLRIKRRGIEADHAPPSSTEVKNMWSSTFAPTICLHVADTSTSVVKGDTSGYVTRHCVIYTGSYDGLGM